MLATAAKHNGRSLSDEIEARLARSLTEERTRNHWLLWAFSDLVEAAERMTGQDWIADPFTHEVARQAITQFFDEIRPEGEPEMPASQKAIVGLDSDKVPADVKQMIISTMVNPTAWGGTLANTLALNLRRAAHRAEHSGEPLNPELERELDRLRTPARFLAGLLEKDTEA
jgi:hypothetical protein